jgi:hemolysin III
VLSVGALSVLVTLAAIGGDVWRVVSFSIYGATLVLLYLVATLYHGFRSPRVKRFFQLLDHAAIYVLIAGSYTPLMLVKLRGGWGWSIFGMIWGLAVAGIVFKILFMGRFIALSTALYVAMGWLILIALRPALGAIPNGCLIWLVMAGCTYSVGILFLAWKRLPYNHALWHMFILAGSGCVFFAFLFHILPIG